MDRDTFSHIRLWCPRPFGTYSQNKVRSTGSGGSGGGAGLPTLCKAEPPPVRRCGDGAVTMAGPEESGGEEGAGMENTPPHPELSSSSLTPSQAPPHSSSSSSSSSTTAPPSVPTSGAQMEDGRVLLDTWYVIKPGNTKEKIAFFVGHQFSGTGLCRPSAMKVKGNWATDCSKAKRRRRCSSYDPPTRSQISSSRPDPPLTAEVPPRPDEPPPEGVSETDLLSVAEMVALVEQRTAMALQGMAAAQGSQQAAHSQGMSTHQHTLLRSTLSDPTPTGYLSEAQPAGEPQGSPSPIQTDQELELDQEEEEEQEESCRVAEAIARFESQSAESGLRLGSGRTAPSAGKEPAPPPPPGPRHGEVRIAFRVSSLEPRCQSEPAGRPRCMFMSCGGGAGQAGQPGPKEKITCDLYQLVSPSSLDPSSLLLAKADADHHHHHHHHHSDRQAGGGPDPGHEPSAGEQREQMTGFHVEVVVTGAVDQCVFYGKDSTENVQEETVCFAMPAADASSDDPPPGQLFFLQPPSRGLEDDQKGPGSSSDCAANNNNNKKGAVGERAGDSPPGGAGTAEAEDCADPSLCCLYRHVSHDFLEIRFQIQRLLEPRQYMLLLPDHIMVNIFSHLPTRSLAALKCTCHDFRALIEAYGVRPVDSRWNQDPLYRDDPCKQCKRQYERGDVSLCRWHPKPYHHDLPYGRSYWMCCRRTDKDTPGCRVGLHDNNWVQALDGSQPAARAKREDRREEAR